MNTNEQELSKKDTIAVTIMGTMVLVGMLLLLFWGTNPIDSVFEQQYDPNIKIYQEQIQNNELNSIK